MNIHNTLESNPQSFAASFNKLFTNVIPDVFLNYLGRITQSCG